MDSLEKDVAERIAGRISGVRDMPSMAEEIEKECYTALNNMKEKLGQEADCHENN